MHPYQRQRSNELAACTRIYQLRKLQNQLGLLIKDVSEYPLDNDEESCLDLSTDSTLPSTLSCNRKDTHSSIRNHVSSLTDESDTSSEIGLGNYSTHSSDIDQTVRMSDSSCNDNSSRSGSIRAKRSSITRSSSSRLFLQTPKRVLLQSGSTKSFRHLPTYDFLQKDNEGKEGGSLRPNAKWWHGVFFFSLISMLACIITLWAPYPIGARMPSETIATMPWSNGCQGIESCICPRETICADDLLSMIFLTIARSTAWFDYPLYMLLFLSKANNLNNFLQKTALRCWINFSDYHRVHSLFGIIVGLESTSHTFFHLLRWARRNNDIQVRHMCEIYIASDKKGMCAYVHQFTHLELYIYIAFYINSCSGQVQQA